MKYPVPTIVAAVLVLLPSFGIAKDFSWIEVVKKVALSVVAVQRPTAGENGEPVIANGCTGFVIHAHDGYVMTAHHCLNEGTADAIFVDGEPTRLVWSSVIHDAAVLSVKTRKPALRLSYRALEWGMPVATLGYGYGLDGALFRAGYVANPGVKDPRTGYPDVTWFVFDRPFIGGQSGGPVFDVDGRVVSIVQMSDNYSGVGRPLAAIYELSKQYWQ